MILYNTRIHLPEKRTIFIYPSNEICEIVSEKIKNSFVCFVFCISFYFYFYL